MKFKYATWIDDKIIGTDDVMFWAEWFAKADRTVAKNQCGDFLVSTVFLGINHGWPGQGDLWFETMVFDADGQEEDCQRYATLQAAQAGHKEAVEKWQSA